MASRSSDVGGMALGEVGGAAADPVGAGDQRLNPYLVVLLAVATGAAVANLYYAQPLLEPISRAFQVSPGRAALVVTLTQLGYAAGLVLILPLGDIWENRRLVTTTLLGTAVALGAAAAAPSFSLLLAAMAAVGVTSVVAQILVPLAAHLAPDHLRGSVVGQVTGGLLMGIMLARTLSSFLAAAFGWRSIFVASAVLMVLLSLTLHRLLPTRRPAGVLGYRRLIASTFVLFANEPVLRRRAMTQGLLFGAFTAFWTGIAYELIDRHGLSQSDLALFALVGASGAAIAPVAGRLADRGWGGPARLAAVLAGLGAVVLAWAGGGSVVLLALAGALLDLGVQGAQVLNLREVYALRPEARARLNAAYMGCVFLSGAIASAVTGALQSSGWAATGAIATACVLGAVALVVGDGVRARRAVAA